VDDGALDHALKGSGRFGLAVVDHQFLQVVIDIAHEVLFQRAKIDLAGRHHCRCIHVIDQGE
jgi:hypothetical protein